MEPVCDGQATELDKAVASVLAINLLTPRTDQFFRLLQHHLLKLTVGTLVPQRLLLVLILLTPLEETID